MEQVQGPKISVQRMQRTVFVLPSTSCREWVRVVQHKPVFSSQLSLHRAACQGLQNLSSCKGPWRTGVEERGKLLPSEKQAVHLHQPRQEGQMLESTTSGVELGVQVPTDPRLSSPLPTYAIRNR